jgi:ribonuclease-3
MSSHSLSSANQAADDLERASERLDLAERKLQIVFKDRNLLFQSLVHRSFVLERERDAATDEPIESNERLEFLGDAILSALVAVFAFRNFPTYDEGRLTEVRSALVRRSTLAVLAEALGLSELMYTGRAERSRLGKGHATVLAEGFEAVLAAVFLDQGLERAQRFLEQQIEGRVDELVGRALELNAKSRLQEFAQASVQTVPKYTLLSRSGAPHQSLFQVEVRVGGESALGSGDSIRAAEQRAANALLSRLGGDNGSTTLSESQHTA